MRLGLTLISIFCLPMILSYPQQLRNTKIPNENRLPVIGLKDTDFVFDEYKGAIIDKDAKKAAAKAKTKYFSQK